MTTRIVNGVTYEISGSNATVTVYDGSVADVIIPESIKIPTDSDPLYNITVVNADTGVFRLLHVIIFLCVFDF